MYQHDFVMIAPLNNILTPSKRYSISKQSPKLMFKYKI